VSNHQKIATGYKSYMKYYFNAEVNKNDEKVPNLNFVYGVDAKKGWHSSVHDILAQFSPRPI
jgi:hypothetical protein